MSITVDNVIGKGRTLDLVIPQLANLCGIYEFHDLNNNQKDKLISMYNDERKANVYIALDEVCGSTTIQELEDSQDELTEMAVYDLDCMIEKEWEDEFGLMAQLNEITLDNRSRNGDLISSNY